MSSNKNTAPHERGQIFPGYKGLFSSYPEWHAFFIGHFYGYNPEYTTENLEKLRDPDNKHYNKDVANETHYALVGYDIGQIHANHKKKIHACLGSTAVTIFAGVYQTFELLAEHGILQQLTKAVGV